MGMGGARPGAGRKLGTTSEATKATREFFAKLLSDDREAELFDKFMECENPKVAFAAFELCVAYKRGKPIQPKEDGDNGWTSNDFKDDIFQPQVHAN